MGQTTVGQKSPFEHEDVVAIVRLLGEVAGLTTPLADRRRHLMSSVAQLIDADTWLWTASQGMTAGDPVAVYALDGGWRDDDERTRFYHANHEPRIMVPFLTGIDFTRHQTFTFDESHPGWGDGSAHRDVLVPLTGLAHVLLSTYPLAGTAGSGMGFHRRVGRPPFAHRERSIVHLVCGQIDWLHRAGTDLPADPQPLHQLTYRQREILLHLLAGDARKQIARKLGLSEYTVNDHLKTIYRRLRVNSNTELLAKFLPGSTASDGDLVVGERRSRIVGD